MGILSNVFALAGGVSTAVGAYLLHPAALLVLLGMCAVVIANVLSKLSKAA